MVESENLPPLRLPDQKVWSSIDIVRGQELHGGHQSRVFAAERNGHRVVVKLVDSRLADGAFHRRVEMSSLLAGIDDAVVGPITIHGGLVFESNGWLVAIYPRVDGRSPLIDDESDVRRMAISMSSRSGVRSLREQAS